MVQHKRFLGCGTVHLWQCRTAATGCADGLGSNLDAVLVTNFELNVRDRAIRTQFRAEVFNVLNRPNFAAPNTSVSSSSFGVVSAQYNKPREIQLALKISF
ncbi:MAG: hypothetical protein JO091_07555 [Acidobacteriaceae bacterium]|nr:hypothetical protein [Acidobacteriaceae bacterium]